MITRRKFLKFGVMGSILLPFVYLVSRFPTSSKILSSSYSFLTENERILLAKICPVLLGDSWQPAVSLPLLLLEIDKLTTYLTESTQKELKRLLALLDFAPFRMMVLKISSWEEVDVSKISSTLMNLRTSRLRFFRMIYLALQQLTFSVYYSFPQTWKKIGYEGPTNIGILTS